MNILFDIGATKTRIAKQESEESFSLPLIVQTQTQYSDGLKILIDGIREVAGGESITHISGCIAGKWDNTKGCITESGNITDWDDKPIRHDLETELGGDVIMDNDAACAGLGEAIYGAGKEYDTILYITVSTGVGGAVIRNKSIFERLEPRKIIIAEKDLSLGKLVSGRAVEQDMGMKPGEIIDANFWDEKARYLASGIAQILEERDVGCIVLGGSMISEVGISIEDTTRHLGSMIQSAPTIRKAELKDFGGLYGTLAQLQRQ